ncbi:MAG: hypothetical protein ACKOYJ_02015 [Planctomycetia bacterium]
MHAPTAPSSRVMSLDAGPIADLSYGLSAHVDPDEPQTGIVCGNDRLLGLDLRSPCQASDLWVRGGDIVASYEPNDPRLLRATALWRRRRCDGVAAWEVIASATTGREHSDVSLSVTSDVEAATILWGIGDGARLQWHPAAPATSPACLLLRREGAGSVLVAGHAGDARRMFVRPYDGRARVECWLFSTAAEKGVLFRGRVMAAVGPAAGDTLWAERAWSDFDASPPVLTT